MKIDGPQRLGFLLNDATRLLRKRFKARATRFGLSMAQWRLLFRLMREEGVPQARLAELLEIEPISVSRLLDRMEEAGWIVRRPCEADRRVRMVYPTDKTRRTYAEIRGIGDELYGEAMAGMSDTERQALLDALRIVVENLSGEETAYGDPLVAAGGE
jgi:DNA-binding MarR family transcriptional regulator